MSDSETSVNNNITYETNNGKNIADYNGKKPATTDTDFYYNMIANPNKTLMEEHSATSESDTPKDNTSRNSSRSPSPRTERQSPTQSTKQQRYSPQPSPKRFSPLPQTFQPPPVIPPETKHKISDG